MPVVEPTDEGPVSPDTSPPADTAPAGGAGEADELTRWVGTLGELTVAVNEQRPLPELLEMIARTACRLLGYESSGVLLANEDRAALDIAGSWGLSEAYIHQVNFERPLDLSVGGEYAASPSRRSFTDGVPTLIDDIASDTTYGPWATAAQAAGHRSMASVPLSSGRRMLGTLNVYGTRPRQLSPTGVQLLQLLAHQAGVALETQELLARDRARLMELGQLNEHLNDHRNLLLAHSQIHDRLMTVVQRAGGLTDATRELAEMTSCAVCVTDTSGAILSSAGHGGLVVVPPDADAAAQSTPLGRTSGAAVISSDTAMPPLASIPIRVGEETLGTLWATYPEDPDELRLRAFEQAAVVIGQTLLLRRAREDAEWQLRGDLLAEMLAGDDIDLGVVLARGDRVGSNLRVPHVLGILTSPDGEPDASRLMGQVRSQAAGTPAGRLLLARREASVVVAAPATDVDMLFQLLRHTRQRILSTTGRTTRAAVSSSVVPTRFNEALRQVIGLLRLVPESPDEPVLTLEDSGLVGFMLADLDPSTVSALAERWVEPLRRYDEKNNANLLATVRAYTDNHQNTAATAAALFVHANTVNLRLRRAEEVLGASLSNLDHLTALRASLLIDDVKRNPLR